MGSGPMNSRLLPLPFLIALVAVSRTPAVLGAALLLTLWYAALLLRRVSFAFEIALHKQHYIQACVQGSVLAYWGWYWPDVYAYLPLLIAQLFFAYVFHMLLVWSRGETYPLGFGVFPIVISINLFLWFKPEWFYLQFALVALGLLAKEFLTWERDGRRRHIFNPSSFPLAIMSVFLLALGASDITRGQEIAVTQFYPPNMYVFLFLIALPGQFLFGVTTMAMSAAVSTILFGWAYYAATGIYFFYDSYIPISVFLGMHLLFTDPATSPRSELGRILYGTLYGLSAVGLYYVLGMRGLPTFYDKLLQVPILNLSAKAIDQFAARIQIPKLAPTLAGRKRHLAFITTWAVVFFSLNATNVLNDNHPGPWIPFWQQACDDGRSYACPYLADLQQGLCNQGSPWACNEAGLMHIALSRSGEDSRRSDPRGSALFFQRGCKLGLDTACRNAAAVAGGSNDFSATEPTLSDYPIVLRGSKGELRDTDPAALLSLACRQGWSNICQH